MRALQQAWRHNPQAANDRRRAPRCDAHLEARLLFSLSLQEAGGSAPPASPQPKPLTGYTRNISETGLALFVPSLKFGDHYLNVVGRQLRIMLKLPTGTVRVHATLVRCERLEALDEEAEGYLLSACISEMNDSEWVELVQYVRTLR